MNNTENYDYHDSNITIRKGKGTWIVFEVMDNGDVNFFRYGVFDNRDDARLFASGIKAKFGGDLCGKIRVEKFPPGYFNGAAESTNTRL